LFGDRRLTCDSGYSPVIGHNRIVAWTFVRPVDPSALDGRPLLDLGTGDAQTLLALTTSQGLRVGMDRSSDALRAARRSGLEIAVAGSAGSLPFTSGAFGTVLAADVFHHADDEALVAILAESRRVAASGGRLIAWWYAAPGRGGPGDPRFPRPYADVAVLVQAAGYSRVTQIELELGLEPSPPTVGLRAGA
jgi:SAM-dependent methyltransferase